MEIPSVVLTEEDPETACFYSALGFFIMIRSSHGEGMACEAFCDAAKPVRSQIHRRCFNAVCDYFDLLEIAYGHDEAAKAFRDIVDGRTSVV